MKKSVRNLLIRHFVGVSQLQSQYARLDVKMSKISDSCDFHCKDGCGACCAGPAYSKEATVFEMLPMAIDFFDKGIADDVLNILLDADDCSQIPCVNYVCVDEKNGCGHCAHHELRPFVCRMFGDSMYHVKEDRLEFTGCHYLKEKFNGNQDFLRKKLPVIGETVMRGRELGEDDFLEITDINTALRDALELVCVKYDLICGKMENED